MTKINIVDKIYEKLGFPKCEVTKIVDTLFDIIKEALQYDDKMMI